jgi:hypothetical protein
MAHLVRAGRTVVNLDCVVEIEIFPEGYAIPKYGQDPHPDLLSVVLTTTAVESQDLWVKEEGSPCPFEIVLRDEEAREFLRALPSSVTSAEERGES